MSHHKYEIDDARQTPSDALFRYLCTDCGAAIEVYKDLSGWAQVDKDYHHGLKMVFCEPGSTGKGSVLAEDQVVLYAKEFGLSLEEGL